MPRHQDALAFGERLHLAAAESPPGALHEWCVADRKAAALVGNEIQEGSNAGGHPLRAASGYVFAREAGDHRVVGELCPRAPKDPRSGLGGSMRGGDEYEVIARVRRSPEIFRLRSSLGGQAVRLGVTASVSSEFQLSHDRKGSLRGVAYHAASVSAARRILLLRCLERWLALLLAIALATACTGGGAGGSTKTPTVASSSPVPTGPVHFQPGEYRYSFGGVTASLSFDGSTATLEVKNASGADLAPPGLYVVSGTGEHVDGSVAGVAPIADGGSATFQVTFPDQVTSKTIGLVILLFGDSNYGAFAPAPAA